MSTDGVSDARHGPWTASTGAGSASGVSMGGDLLPGRPPVDPARGRGGAAVGEVGALRWTDIDFTKREVNVLVRGNEGSPKGGKARAVPMSGRLYRALAA